MNKILSLSTLLLATAFTSYGQAAECGGEPLPDSTLCAPDEGINPNTGDDLSGAIPALLAKSKAEQKGIFFPAGKYRFSKDIALTSWNSLLGSPQGTVFQGVNGSGNAILVGDETYNNQLSDLTISHIIFDNARVGFYGRKTNIDINYNVFINTRTAASIAQLTASTNPYLIRGNVFMRGKNYPGVGLSTYGNAPGLIVEHNFLGSPAKASHATPWLLSDTRAMLTTLMAQRQKGTVAFDDVQDKFVAGWYSTSNLRDGVFRNNYISGSTDQMLYNPVTNANDIIRDHAIYIKQYDKVVIAQNYFSGWPADAFGQIKVRNATGLAFVANTLDGISFNARPYDNVDKAWWIMNDTWVFNNWVKNGVISYWQNFYDTPDKYITVKNYLVFSNVFDTTDKKSCLISGQSRSLSTEFYASNNTFSDGTSGVQTCGVINPIPLNEATARLPDYARALLNLKPLQPAK